MRSGFAGRAREFAYDSRSESATGTPLLAPRRFLKLAKAAAIALVVFVGVLISSANLDGLAERESVLRLVGLPS